MHLALPRTRHIQSYLDIGYYTQTQRRGKNRYVCVLCAVKYNKLKNKYFLLPFHICKYRK